MNQRTQEAINVLKGSGLLDRCTRLVVTADVCAFDLVPSVAGSVKVEPKPAESGQKRTLLEEIKELLPGAVFPGDK